MKKKFLPIGFRFAILLMIGLWAGNCVKAQVITTIAAASRIGSFGGDGGPATNARFWLVRGVTQDNSGNMYIVDGSNSRVRKVNGSGTISTFAGNGIFPGTTSYGGPATAFSLYFPLDITVDGSGNVYVLTSDGTLLKVNTAGIISCIAGNGTTGFSGDGGPATAASFSRPNGLALDGSGNIYIADTYNNRIRKINTSGIISTIAGTGSSGFSGDGGPATAAEFDHPNGIAVDTSGHVYISDWFNHKVRKIDLSGTISTFAGDTASTWGDGGPATAAYLYCNGLTLDRNGNLYVVGIGEIRKINTSGIISTVAGNHIFGLSGDGGQATAAQISCTNGIFVDNSGNIFFSDARSNRIRKISTSGIISTVAGGGYAGLGDGGPAISAQLNDPKCVVSDRHGNLYIADSRNERIRKINSAGVISTYAGGNTYGSAGDGGPATAASLNEPTSIALDKNGNMYVASSGAYWFSGAGSHIVRKISSSGIITTIAGNDTLGYSGDGGPATNARLGYISAMVVDTIGNLFIADGYYSKVRKISTSGIITTYVGYSYYAGCGYSGDGGPSTSARICGPSGLAIDTFGNLHICDVYNERIRTVNSAGTINTIAGTGYGAFSGDGGPATDAELNSPCAIDVDRIGNLYFCDGGNSRIRKINTSGVMSTIGGNGGGGSYGDGGPATAAGILAPSSMAVDSSMNLYFVDDYSSIRKIHASVSGTIASITGPSTFCAGASATFTDSSTGGLWGINWPSVATIDPITGIATGIGGGTATIYYNVGSSFAYRTITVMPLPRVDTISGPATVCAGSAISLIDTSTGGTWNSGTLSVATVSSGGTVTGVSAGTTTISYSVTNSCGTAVATRTVTINPLPNARTITGASVVCAGSAITLVDTASGGTWSSGTTSVATISSGGIVTGVSAGATTISYSVTNSCGTAVATHTVTVNPLPRAGTITGASVVCPGSTITLADTASGGTWSTSSASLATAGSGGVVAGVSVGTVVVSYTVTNSCGTAVDTMIITVNPMPNSGSISGVTSLCVGASAITLTETVTGGAWSSGSTSLATVSSSGVVTPIAAGVVTISYSVTNSCGTAVSIHNITITGPPAVSSITGVSSFCLGDSTVLSDGTAGGIWTSGTPAIAAVNSSGTVTAASTGTVIISYTVTNSCGSSSATRAVTINAAPAVLPITGPASLCIGSVIVLTDSSSGGVWSSGSTGIATVNSFGVVSGVAAGTDTVRYTITTGCGSASAVYVLTILAAPSTAVISGASAICPGDSTLFTASLAGGSWTSGSATIATVNSTGEVYSVAAGAATISYTISNICGSSYGVQTITVNPLPFAGAISGTDSLCPGLTSTFTDATVGGAWVSENPSIATVDGSGVVSSLTAGTVNILYVVTNSCGSDTAVFPFVVKGMVDCPDAVTGIALEDESRLTIYPNPNDGNFIISGNINASGELTFEVRDIIGRVVKTGSGSVINGKFEVAVQLDRALNDGYYYVRIFAGGVVLAGSFVVGR